MPNINPGAPVAPGVATGTSGYPQYGVGGGTPGSSAGWKIVVANNEAQKLAYEAGGYLIWFTTRAAAQNEISSESSAYGSGEAPDTFFEGLLSNLTSRDLWIRIAEAVIGGGLILIGIAALLRKPAEAVASTAAKVAK
jgi:hypothetical protein